MKSDRVYLFDMLTAAQNIALFSEGMTPESFVENLCAVRSVAFELMALGESAKFVSHQMQRHLPQIAWDDLRLVRNTVAHEHFALNPHTLYRTAIREIPLIAAALRDVMAEAP